MIAIIHSTKGLVLCNKKMCPAGHSLADGVQNDEAAVTEHGDGDDPAHELDGKLRMLFADELDHAVSHFERRAGALKQRADQSAEDDHDADARERAREAGADDVGNAADGVAVGVRGVDQRNTGDQAEYQRNGHDREERMDLQLADAEDHQCDGKNEDNDQSNASHRCFLPVFLFLWVFVGHFPCTQYSSAARKIHIEKQQIFSDFLLKITSSSCISKAEIPVERRYLCFDQCLSRQAIMLCSSAFIRAVFPAAAG